MRTLLIVMTVIAVLLAFHMHRVRTQQRVIREVRDFGGNAYPISMDRMAVIVEHPEWVPKALRPLSFSNINFITLEGEEISDAEVAVALQLPNLQGLELTFFPITDASLERLKQCTGLLYLSIWESPSISDADLDELREALPDCEIEVVPWYSFAD